MKIKEGEKIPLSEFFYLDSKGPQKIKSTDLFHNQKAIIIGVPGAFTKICSAKHLPGYVNNFETAKKKGVTKIICISVNDPNVMKAWGESQKIEDKIFMVNENIRPLTSELGDVLLEYNYLSSPDKLTQYQTQYFEKDLIKIDITKIKKLTEKNNQIKIDDLIKKIHDEQ